MAEYRLYTLSAEGRVTDPAVEKTFNNDTDALLFAAQMACVGSDMEVWQLARFVSRVPAESMKHADLAALPE